MFQTFDKHCIVWFWVAVMVCSFLARFTYYYFTCPEFKYGMHWIYKIAFKSQNKKERTYTKVDDKWFLLKEAILSCWPATSSINSLISLFIITFLFILLYCYLTGIVNSWTCWWVIVKGFYRLLYSKALRTVWLSFRKITLGQ